MTYDSDIICHAPQCVPHPKLQQTTQSCVLPSLGAQDGPTTGTGGTRGIYRLTWACQVLYKTSTQLEDLQRSHEHLVGYIEQRLVGYLGPVVFC